MKKIIMIFSAIALLIASYFIYILCITKEGFVGIEIVEIDGIRYRYEGFTISEEGRTIALIDNWQINEIPEDPSHTFLVVRSFLDQYYIVKEDYVIPESGNISCAYFGVTRKRTTDEKILTALEEILNTDYADHNEITLTYYKNDALDLKHITVGYGDCPTGTDSPIYGIGKYNSEWIVILDREVGEWNKDQCTAVYHKLSEEHEELFERSGLFY